MTNAQPSNYEASSIEVLKGLEGVRKRPAMYVGDTGEKGFHHLVLEIVDNSIDEAMQGHCDTIDIEIAQDGKTISIRDNGRGIPVDIHPTEKKSALEIVLTQLHAGGKFGGAGSGYEASGGLHGVGASCVNALSSNLFAEVWRDQGYYHQTFSRGIPKTEVIRVRDLTKKDQKGTRITFTPDDQIFKDTKAFKDSILTRRVKELSFLNKGLTINYRNISTGVNEIFKADGGVADYIKYLTEARSGAYPSDPIFCEVKASCPWAKGEIILQIALNWTEEDDETIISFANNINTIDGGTHTTGFKNALTRVVNQFGRNIGLLKDKSSNLSGDDVREGLTAIINLRLPQPEFVGQTKQKLGTVEIEGIVNTSVSDMLTGFFEKNAAIIKKVVERALIAQEARDAAKKQASLIKRKGFLGNSHRMPGKLYDCNTENRDISELFIVEGKSAAGSGRDGRDPETQAILPIRGKIINAEKHDLSNLLKNEEIMSLIRAIGTNIKDEFDLDKRRYQKIIIMSDADDDGSHIATLLITFFYRFMRPLLSAGHIYVACPPLFCVDHGKQRVYCWTQDELQKSVEGFGGKTKVKVVRFKGLGEMDAEQLAETTMNKATRRLIQLTANDPAENERLIAVLMGSNVAARKHHIATRVNSVVG